MKNVESMCDNARCELAESVEPGLDVSASEAKDKNAPFSQQEQNIYFFHGT